nr:unnamed protein product [Digitaria exilis]
MIYVYGSEILATMSALSLMAWMVGLHGSLIKLQILSKYFYRPGLIFLILLGLDITSHWFQMYRSFLSKTSHKDVKHTGNWLLKLYYGYRPFMAFCCVSCEVLYIILFLFADEKSTSLLSVCRGILNQSPLIILVFISTLVGWAVKQVTNVIQMKTATDACVVYDLKRSK